MKIVQINATCGVGSTGKICAGISRLMTECGIENYIIHSCLTNGYPLGIAVSDSKYIKAQALRARLFGNYGFNSSKATKRMIAELERLKPDVVHLHNIHGHDCDLEMLFTYFKKNNTKLVWTFHDCWTFTGYCTYFDMAKCNKWQTRCEKCIQKGAYSWLFDKSGKLFDRKKQLFSGLDLTIVTPSVWLANMVKKSFLKDYPVRVIYNGINLDVFKPTPSDFRAKYALINKKIVLGVSTEWGERKGLDVFVDLADRLPDDYQIVLVGTDPNIDKQLPKKIISINRTQNQRELAEIYSAADVFVNPTRDEVLGLVNIEALACGTPGTTFNSGGSPECYDEYCGSVVERDSIDELEKEIVRICTEKPYTAEACITKAGEFNENERYREYIELYERINTARTEGN